MTNPLFDAGIFVIMLVVGFIPIFIYKKTGAIVLVISMFSFLIIGLIILTGNDVASITQISTNSNSTTQTINGTITESNNSTTNQINYIIGNGSLPNGIGQLWMGFAFIILTIIIGAVLIDQAMKKNLIGE